MSYLFLFPGQGAQSVGMGNDFYETFGAAKKRIDEANEILDRDLQTLMFEGPEDELKATQNTQPALFTIEAAITDVLNEKGITPSFTMGHSLGEYSALYAAGIYSFEDGLQIVAKRGSLMAEAGTQSQGTMAAVIGLSREVISEVLSEITDGVVVPANENSPGGAFHSPLMQPAADAFLPFLDTFTFNAPHCPVITNVTAQPENDPDVIKRLLVKQLLSPVKWIDSIEAVKQMGVEHYCEVGPGSVLKGLVRKCDRTINVVSCNTVDNLYSLTNS